MTISLSNSKYRPDIDGLRAIAVLSVVAFHAFPSLVKGGFIGVDVFFVISGYLISTIIFENLDKGTFSFKEFYSRRIRRIFPALLIVLAVSYVLGWFTLLENEYKQLGKHIVGGAGFVSNILLWKESGYFDNAAQTKPLLHLWSLGVEEQFYIVYPLLIWFAWKRKLNLLTVIIVLAIVSFYLNLKSIKNNAVATFYSPQTRFWELMCGSLLAWATLYKKDALEKWLPIGTYREPRNFAGTTLANIASFVGLLLLVYGFLRINKALSFPGGWAFIPVLGSILIIVAGQQTWVNKNILSNRILVWFGLISFPLYLWHWVLLTFPRIFLGDTPNETIRIITVVLSIFLSWLTYKALEIPIRRGESNALKVYVLTALMLLELLIGYFTQKFNGLEFREINSLNKNVSAALSYDWRDGFRHGKCFLDAMDEKSNKFDESCVSTLIQDRPLIMIWGDSHAASLYRGFVKNKEKFNFNLAQFTASGCPPILDFYISNRTECSAINSSVFKRVKELKPDTLVMAGSWSMYRSGPDKWEDLDLIKLEKTIRVVKFLGIKRIVLMGHLPVYNINQANMLRRRFSWEKVSTRTYRNFNEAAFSFDEKIRSVARKTNTSFISPLELLCNKNGCLIATEDAEVSPLSFDYGHLTSIGSEHLVSKFFTNGLSNSTK